MGVPYGPTTVVRKVVTGSTEVGGVTFYTPTEDGEYLLYAKITGGTFWSINIAWTDQESNTQSAASSGGYTPLTLVRAKGSTNLTYDITGGSGTYTATIVLVKQSS